MIANLIAAETCVDSLLACVVHYPKITSENEKLSFERFIKDLEGCGADLEPLPLFSPPCVETLRAVSPSIFDMQADEEAPLPRFALEEDHNISWLLSLSHKHHSQEPAFVQNTPSLSTYDVVCSRAKQFQDLPGCQRFRQIVRAAIPEYVKATTRRQKTALIASIIEEVLTHPDGGVVRFLKHESSDNTWSTLRNHQIRDKVGHALRETIQEMARAERKKTQPVLHQAVARAS
ncbi:hypothetical protein FisN_37Hu029 [Fistulifera solaris]|jgi:hypothetical protein|uniref:DUF6824 domain-containing protein n=1 Tax=Fistulifera solaris TaxID=1519565 RepID=A0A1Z5KK63_FISSO|nr:hypothetical protein FisN_37Hu029 [Fistulifera solaris]|eukprot:GAX26421.1 hypothetical protein FisN_37Hu029 [Fistulifera solaris]